MKATFGSDSLEISAERANGMRVSEVRERLEQACDCEIPDNCEVLVDNQPSSMDTVLTNGEIVRFTVSAGKKG